MPKTYEIISPNHAVEVRECPVGGFHEWVQFSASGYEIERRQCGKCNLSQVWRLKRKPDSTNAPQLGVWEDAL